MDRMLGYVLVSFMSLSAAGAETRPAYDPDKEKAEGFVSLFDGKSFSGWVPRKGLDGEEVAEEDAYFTVKDGMIYCLDRGTDDWLATRKQYGDFVLRLEYKLTIDANSGIFLRAPLEEPGLGGFEVQIIDDVGKQPGKETTGAVFDVLAPKKNLSRPLGEWNEMEVRVQGLKVTVVLNGVKVVDTDFAELTKPVGKFEFPYAKMPVRGYIGLQSGGGEFWYRNIRIKELKKDDGEKEKKAP